MPWWVMKFSTGQQIPASVVRCSSFRPETSGQNIVFIWTIAVSPGDRLRQRDTGHPGPAAEDAVVGDGQVHRHQFEEEAGATFVSPEGQALHRPKGQQALDGQVAE